LYGWASIGMDLPELVEQSYKEGPQEEPPTPTAHDEIPSLG